MKVTVYFKKSEMIGRTDKDIYTSIIERLKANNIPAYLTTKPSLKISHGKLNHGPCKRTDNYYVTWIYTSPLEHLTEFFHKIVDSYHKFIRKVRNE